LARLKVFEGMPAPYDTTKKQYIPDAMRCVKLASFRKFCTLGDLSSQVGWGKQQVIAKLEAKRKERGLVWHKKRIEKRVKRQTAPAAAEINKLREQLAQYGY
jgi:large subunit ribosomal protein L13Ae